MTQLIKAVLLSAGLAANLYAESSPPGKADLVGESLTGFGTGLAAAYLGGLAGSALHTDRSDGMDMSGFFGGAIVGYALGIPMGVYGYSRLRGLERNPWLAVAGSVAATALAMVVISATYEDNQVVGPALFIALPTFAAMTGNNLGLWVGNRRVGMAASF